MTTTLEKLARSAKVKPDLVETVDKLGAIKAAIADLETQEKALSDVLKASGKKEIDGKIFRATVASFTRSTLVAELVKKFLSPKQIVECTKETSVTTVKVVARK